ncbi:MAG: hypothetical protein A2655_00015 [Candidatus Yanofskybacteria bacterium RIFCSPHIGHO2_01_FULL_43_42]|uniref:Peptidase S49 domain-containing protein n=1 Tax=Candidatus Yanofskybacteria bacterium RIFCSPLOWO2_01_FULL_43_22 TaxID=1802695 RepID=A0A1F8GEE0_9BACT|nr:MAG: hypothetical protein A2655_00015 [Candidatus Yanofskybacteria bacterium RIFCSPHIGHO2_01_FULL_43_42]OGN12536.1 MAG: hypothetical protein A3D48_04350 [Candidatus Yanofskybacteria bacterium RIFCSPHIGHO2_02_FULL_43_17]OGN23683.1 MAG: hypothetical protein A3A13_00010 [Candidatus Yanofskybacteria bacterium RIFCSPLOWO2_01_FULL_43_22]
MAPWFTRAMIRGLIGPVAYGIVSILVCLFYLWVFGSVFGGNNLSNSGKVYKNYTEKIFVDEITADQETLGEYKKASEQLVSLEAKEGTFVVIPITGSILGDNAQRIWDQLYIATRITQNTKAIIFFVDSPGGGVTESDHLFEEIRKIRTTGIKTVTFVNGLSASGAYYITAQSDKIISSPTAIVGSIGVIWESINVEELSRKIGISVDVIKSSDMKDIGSPFKKMSDGEKVVLRRVVNHSYDRFKSIVRKGRGLSASQVNLVATGEVWHSEDSRKLGLIDEVGYINKAIDVAMELTGVRMPTIVQYEESLTLWDALGTRSPFIGLVKNLDNAVNNPGILAPKLFYMWIP